MKGLLLDPEDEILREKAYPWKSRHGATYAFSTEGPLHRFIIGACKGMDVDHINGNTLDNRKANLRIVTRSVNNRNSLMGAGSMVTPYRGVGYHKASGLWYSRIKHYGKTISLGYHKTAELAQRARLLKEKELWGIEPRRLPFFQAAGLA